MIARSAAVLLACALACATYDPADEDARPSDGPHYLQHVAFDVPGRGGTVMRWQTSQMPLRVHLPAPPDGMFAERDRVMAVVRKGITDWTDVAAPGVPSFRFVEADERSDIPVVWAPIAHGWWVAFAAYDLTGDSKIFRVNRILVAAKYPDGREATPEDLYLTMLHEMGHALGLLGHSPYPEDVMYEKGTWETEGMTERDRNTLRKLYSRPVGAKITGAKRRPE
jgi:predicted Zn-dependent protease